MADDSKTGDLVRTKSDLVGRIASIVQLTAYVRITQKDGDAIMPCLLSELIRVDSPDHVELDAN